MSRIKGKGRKWIIDLPEINFDEVGQDLKDSEILFFDPISSRFEQFKEVLAGYGLNLIYVSSIQAVVSELSRNSSKISCVYLDELPASNGGVMFKETLAKLPNNSRPPVIAGTASQNARSTNDIRYILKPFGLGVLLDMLQGAIKSKRQFKIVSSANYEVTYQVPGKLLGLDETGGVVQLKFPMFKDSHINLDNDTLNDIWNGENKVEIAEVAVLDDKPDTWQIKFNSPNALGNKSKYLQSIKEFLKAK